MGFQLLEQDLLFKHEEKLLDIANIFSGLPTFISIEIDELNWLINQIMIRGMSK